MKTALPILLVVLLAGCGFVHITGVAGSGRVITTNMNLSGFDSIDAGSAFVVHVKSGDRFAVSIATDDNLTDKISVTKDGSWLRIGIKPNTSIRPTTLTADVVLPNLAGLSASGASRITFDSFKTGRFTADASGASAVNGDINAGSAHIECSGASNFQLTGGVAKLELGGSGASRMELGGLTANEADVDLSGASSATVSASQQLDYGVSGASHLTYSGQPRIGRSGSSGASSVSQR